MAFRRCGRSGLLLPLFSLGLWQNFGSGVPFENGRAMCRRAFDLGITHFDLANNYGPYRGAAEENFGRILASDLRPYRDEIVVSTKAGFRMWPGPYGDGGSRKYLLASLDSSLKRMGLDYVDIFYSHRPDPETQLDETMSALASAVAQGKALYAGISSYDAKSTAEAASILRALGTRAIIHQPSYSILNRHLEADRMLDRLQTEGMGCIVFSPLSQGLLTGKYLEGVPAESRAAVGRTLGSEAITPVILKQIRRLNALAERRSQSLAQMALAWVLRDKRVTSVLIGASRVEQIEENVAALENLSFNEEELAAIDSIAV